MKLSAQQKTLGLMLLSMLFGGSFVQILHLSNSETTVKSLAKEAVVGSSAPASASSMPAGHPSISSTMNASSESAQAGSIEELVIGLRNRLDSNPNDVKGWALLARSYQHLGQMQAAQVAAEKARKLGYKGEVLTSSGSSIHNPNAIIKQPPTVFEDEFFTPVDTDVRQAD